jgi:photosystem II stability/assembly factor-like uncharacterized protein
LLDSRKAVSHLRTERASPAGRNRGRFELRTRFAWLAVGFLLWSSPAAPQRSIPVLVHPQRPTGWSSTGPVGTYVTALAVDKTRPADIYMATETGGILKSADKGISWRTLRKPLPQERVVSVAVQTLTGNLFAGTSNGVTRSVDGGATWTDPSVQSTTDTSNGKIFALGLATHPVEPCTVFAGTPSLLFKTIDCGSTWKVISGSPQYSTWIVFDPSDPRVMYCASQLGIYRSLNGGSNWTYRGGPNYFPFISLAIDPASPSTLYSVNFYDSRILKSTDQASTWVEVFRGNSSQAPTSIAFASGSPSVVYAATISGGVLRSLDGGTTWDSPNAGLGTLKNLFPYSSVYFNYYLAAVPVADPDDPLTVYVGSYGGGLFKSSDGGENWILLNTGVPDSRIASLAADPIAADTVYAAADISGLFKSANGGRGWNRLEGVGLTDRTLRSVVVDPTNRSILYLGTGEGHVFKSVDAGETWTGMSTGLPSVPDLGIAQLVIDPTHPSVLYAALASRYGVSGYGLFKSADGGATWHQSAGGLGNDLIKDHEVRELAIDPNSGLLLYAVSFFGEFFESRDGGQNWRTIHNGLPVVPGNLTTVGTIAIAPSSPDIAYVSGIDGAPPNVWKTTNGGQKWFPPSDPLGYPGVPDGFPKNVWITTMVVDPNDSETVYAGTDRFGVYRTTDGGKSWGPFNAGLEDQFINCLVVHPAGSDRIYTGTNGSGVFHLPVSGLFGLPPR